MQVNNVQSPNFGMALKISKGAKDALKDLPMETIEKLQKAGEDLKDTKFYHVRVKNNLDAEITADKDAYFGLFPKRMDGYYAIRHGECNEGGKMVPDKCIIMLEKDGGTIAGVARYVDSAPFFKAWGAVGPYNRVDDINSLAKIAKVLDGVAADEVYKQTAKESAELAKKAEVSKAVDNLLDTFGE